MKVQEFDALGEILINMQLNDLLDKFRYIEKRKNQDLLIAYQEYFEKCGEKPEKLIQDMY